VAVSPNKVQDRKEDLTDFSHVGPDTLSGRYLRHFWHPVHRSQDLRAGQAITTRLLGEEFTLYRGQSGTVHMVGGRCAHRGTQLSTGWVEEDCIRCFYHGWKYDGDGRCVEQPAEDEGFARKVSVDGHPVHEYLGLIFAYVGEGTPPPMPHFRFMEEFDESKAFRITEKFTKGYNYRHGMENSVDPVHVAFVHRNSEYRGLPGCPSVEAEETDYGLKLRSIRPHGSIRITQWQMPTILYIKQGPRDPAETAWRDFLLWRKPVDDESFVELSASLVYMPEGERQRFLHSNEAMMANDPAPELGMKALRNEIHTDDITDLQLAVNVQDYVAQYGQGTFYDRSGERLGRSDVGVILLRKLYARELTALAEGRPLTSWKTFEPEATTGL